METEDRYTIKVVFNDKTLQYRREVESFGITWSKELLLTAEVETEFGKWFDVTTEEQEVFEAIYQAGVSKGKRGQHEKQADRQRVS